MKRFDPIVVAVWGTLLVVATIMLLTPNADAQSHVVILKPATQVSGDNVTLGDLLASAGGNSFKEVLICPAPDLGSVRTLNAAEVSDMLKKHGLDFTLRGAQRVSITRAGRRISANDLRPLIESAVQGRGSETTVGVIQVQSAILIPLDARIQLTRLKFDPAINGHRASFAVMKGAKRISSFEAFAVLGPGTAPYEVDVAPERMADQSSAAVVRRGSTAKMQIRGNGFSATLTVTCLEDGNREQTIRARDLASKKIYRAQVLSDGSLLEVSREN